MRLETSDRGDLKQPTEYDVAQALARLEAGAADFAILGRSDEDYVQANATEVEYRAAGAQYRCTDPVTPELRRRVFLAFLDGGTKYREACGWERLQL